MNLCLNRIVNDSVCAPYVNTGKLHSLNSFVLEIEIISYNFQVLDDCCTLSSSYQDSRYPFDYLEIKPTSFYTKLEPANIILSVLIIHSETHYRRSYFKKVNNYDSIVLLLVTFYFM